MLVINDLTRINHPEILNLVKQRRAEIGPNFNALVLEPLDSVPDLGTALGCPILTNILDQAVFDSDDFSPNFEVAEDQGDFYERVFILGDDDGMELLIRKALGIDANLLALCAQYAVAV